VFEKLRYFECTPYKTLVFEKVITNAPKTLLCCNQKCMTFVYILLVTKSTFLVILETCKNLRSTFSSQMPPEPQTGTSEATDTVFRQKAGTKCKNTILWLNSRFIAGVGESANRTKTFLFTLLLRNRIS
jgi:hypothetical protein